MKSFQQKKPAQRQRLFRGLAGSPLAQTLTAKPVTPPSAQAQATVDSLMEAVRVGTPGQTKEILREAFDESEPTTDSPTPKRDRGRPRKWNNDAERKRTERATAKQRLANLLQHFDLKLDSLIPSGLKTKYQITVATYRELLALEGIESRVLKEIHRDLKLIGKIKVLPKPKSLADLAREQKIDDETGGRGAGMLLSDAPQGKGRLSTGEFGSKKADTIRGLQETEKQSLSKPDESFEPGDLIGVPMSIVRFPDGDRRRVRPKGYGPHNGEEE